MLSAGAVVTPLTALACDWAGGVTVRPPRPHLSPGGSDEMSRRVFPPVTVPCLQVSAAARLPLAAGRPSLFPSPSSPFSFSGLPAVVLSKSLEVHVNGTSPVLPFTDFLRHRSLEAMWWVPPSWNPAGRARRDFTLAGRGLRSLPPVWPGSDCRSLRCLPWS